ncbi:hypothetical protein ACM9HF_07010 [Colwellia sp. RE-S-Sl-9]
MKIALIFICSFFIISCVTTQPKNTFNGNYAVMDDSYRNNGSFGGGTDYFFIEKIDDSKVYNAFQRDRNKSSNNYSQLGFTRNIEAKELNLTISAQKLFRTLFNTLASDEGYSNINGQISFTPEVGKHYLVNGVILKNYTAVWIEDGRGNIVSELVESEYLTNEQARNEKFNLKLDKNNKVNKTQKELFSTIMTGESYQLITYKFGEPDEILHPNKNSTFIYNGLGQVKFIRQSKSEAYVYMTIPTINDDSLSVGSVRALIEPATGRTIRELAKEYYGMNIQDVKILDVFAEKIWKERNHQDRYMLDGVAWLCKILGQSKNARYKSLLKALLEPKTSKLKKRHVESSLEMLTGNEEVQFEFR